MNESEFETPPSKLQVGVVGAGVVATEAHIPILSSRDDVEIKYIADVDGEQTKSLARANGTDPHIIDDPSAVPDCDIALLATPVGAREEYMKVFGGRGTPVFAEKPFAISCAQHMTFLDLVDTPFCNYMRTKFGAMDQLQTLVTTELFGPVHSVSVTESYPGKSGGSRTYMTDSELSGGGILMDHGVHIMSQLFHIFPNATPTVDDVSVVAVDGLDVDVKSKLSFESDTRTVMVDLHLSTVDPTENRILIEFDHGVASLRHADPGANVKIHTSTSVTDRLELSQNETGAYSWKQAIYLMWDEFIQALRAGTDYDANSHTGFAITELVEEMYDNAEIVENLNP